MYVMIALWNEEKKMESFVLCSHTCQLITLRMMLLCLKMSGTLAEFAGVLKLILAQYNE